MKIANIPLSSMKANGPRLRDWLRKRRPDIVTLQKIGLERDFPARALREAGYESAFLGRRSASDLGVAVLGSRRLEARVRALPGAGERESRFLTADIGGLRVSSVYAPYGPNGGSKQAVERRIAWLNRLYDRLRDEGRHRRDSLLCGDFNVRIDDKSENRPLRDALEKLEDLGFCDLYRRAHPDREEDPGRTWGYRGEKSAEGKSRLHLALASESLARRLRSARLDIEGNPWPRPDAPPLVVEFDDAGT